MAAKDPDEELTNTHEGLETVDADEIKQMAKIVSETDHPHADLVTGESDGNADNGFDTHRKKVTKDAKKDLLFHSANTWENMDEVPE